MRRVRNGAGRERHPLGRGGGGALPPLPEAAGAVALSAADRDALSSFARSEPALAVASPDSIRPDGALDRLLRSALEAFVERSFRTYRHLRAATRGGRTT